jgi:hypothetical protein
LAVLARGGDPPEPPDGLRPLRLRRGGLGRAGPGDNLSTEPVDGNIFAPGAMDC